MIHAGSATFPSDKVRLNVGGQIFVASIFAFFLFAYKTDIWAKYRRHH